LSDRDALRLYLPSYDTCFVCGKRNPNGLKLGLYLENGRVTAEFTPREDLCGFSGILHGGIISCVIDEALWWSSSVRSGRLVVTKDLTINYLKSLKIRKTYRVEAETAQPQGGVYRCVGRITDQTGSICVEGEGTYFPLRWGKNRDPEKMLSYVDEKGNPLPEDRTYRFRAEKDLK
jgi:acyl-coenzyme A thioesterase PaaI-like protein